MLYIGKLKLDVEERLSVIDDVVVVEGVSEIDDSVRAGALNSFIWSSLNVFAKSDKFNCGILGIRR